MDRVLDFSVPLDVDLLDNIVDTFYNGSGQQRLDAQRVVQQFTEDPRAWRTADTILTKSRSQSTKFLALSMLDRTIKVCHTPTHTHTHTHICVTDTLCLKHTSSALFTFFF